MFTKYYKYINNTAAGLLEVPQYLIFFVSDKCPNNCSHCWYNKEWKQENLMGPNLSLEEIEKISKSIPGLKFLSITGGEAFLRDDIIGVVKAFCTNSKIKRFDIPTSGFDSDLIKTRAVEILKTIGDIPFRVDVSLDGTETVHNSIRRNKSAFDNALKTIEELKKIKSMYKNFDLSIITTISDDNYANIDDLSELIDEIFPNGEWMINIVRYSDPLKYPKMEVQQAYNRANEILDKRINTKRIKGDTAYKRGKWLTAKNVVRRDTITKIMSGKKPGFCCAAGSLAGVIFNDGDIRPCETLYKSFGNIRDYDYDLKAAWSSDKARKIRNEIINSRCMCTHECFLSVSLLTDPLSAGRLIKERII